MLAPAFAELGCVVKTTLLGTSAAVTLKVVDVAPPRLPSAAVKV